MCLFLLLADSLYIDPVDPERGQLPSPEELKGKILVKVHMLHTYMPMVRTYSMCVHVQVHVYSRYVGMFVLYYAIPCINVCMYIS